jgi:hypothetical protein
MKKLIMTLLLIQPITLNAAETISLKCELDGLGIYQYKLSEIYRENYTKALDHFNKKDAERMALATRAAYLEFNLKGFEVVKDVWNVRELGDGMLIGQQYQWKPDKLIYANYIGHEFYTAIISRETLNYNVSLTNFSKKIFGNDSFSGKCEIQEFKPKF